MENKYEFTPEELKNYLEKDDWIIEDETDLEKIADFCGFVFDHDKKLWINEKEYINKYDVVRKPKDLEEIYHNFDPE